MSTETTREREVKLHLDDEAAWAAIRHTLGSPEAVLHQTNTYFDTRDRRLLRTGRLMVRVREENGRIRIQAKDRVRDSVGLLESRERAADLTPEQWRRVHRTEVALSALPLELAAALGHEAGGALYPIGSVVNRREVYRLADGYLAEVDRTEFPGGRIDFEVELELRQVHHTAAAAVAALDAAAPGHGVDSLPNPRSKYARFLAALDALESA